MESSAPHRVLAGLQSRRLAAPRNGAKDAELIAADRDGSPSSAMEFIYPKCRRRRLKKSSPVGAGGDPGAVPAEAALELVEDRVVLIQIAELGKSSGLAKPEDHQRGPALGALTLGRRCSWTWKVATGPESMLMSQS